MTHGVKTPETIIGPIRREYIESPDKPSIEALSQKHALPFGTILDYSKKEKWTEKRSEFYQKLAQKTLELVLERASEQRAKEIQVIEAVWAKSAEKLLEAIESGKYEPTPSDLDKITRLRAYLLGEADVRHGIMREEKPDIADILRRIEGVTAKNGDIRRIEENGD